MALKLAVRLWCIWPAGFAISTQSHLGPIYAYDARETKCESSERLRIGKRLVSIRDLYESNAGPSHIEPIQLNCTCRRNCGYSYKNMLENIRWPTVKDG